MFPQSTTHFPLCCVNPHPPRSHAPSLSQLSGFLRSYLLGEEGDDLGADCVQPLDDLRLRDTEGGRVRYKQVQKLIRPARPTTAPSRERVPSE